MGDTGCEQYMYYDKPTRSCTHCSVLCDNMDIQATRDQCMKYCFDYMQTTSTTTVETSTHPVMKAQVPVIAICVLLFLITFLILGSLIFYHRKMLVDRLKRQDCCRDGSQHHAQESGREMDHFRYAQETRQDSAKPEAHSLLPSGHQAFPEMPQPR
ncbi:uncharacterized protein [Haliotis cracherodii]|uniref:uncharacterized protein n=1 Tax=Haliotis cracherodii TaxID=6455 RepID=UPI0039E79CC7